MKSLPIRARVFISMVAVAAATLLTLVAISQAGDPRFGGIDVRLALIFGLFVFIVDQFPVTLALGEGVYSVSFVIVIAAIILGGPVEGGIAAASGFMTAREARRVHPIRHLFNMSELALTGTFAALAYWALIGDRVTRQDMFPRVFVPVLAATAVHFIVNTTLVATVFALVRGERFRDMWRTQFGKLAGGYVAFALLGIVLAALYISGLGAASVIFLFVPLLVARGAFQSAIEMETAYEATVGSLIKAIEAKDPYTRGHAMRVARLSEMTARAYGLAPQQCRVIRYIALMHDVGKLGVSTKILAKPGKLTDEEYEHMKAHPVRGYEIVSEIDFLHQAAETAVRHHHERMDGRGYPDGLKGDEIPVFARIVMVCDAFDSMTSTRVYRKAKGIEDAVAELRRCAGTQFDPVSLAALEKAISREGWEAEPEQDEEVTGATAAAL
ncbi:MAG: HD domain-containing phosphohydrolase [Actinomycetota bacterium]